MRRLLVLALLAPVLVPASAFADGFNLDLGMPVGGARVHSFEDCPGTTCERSAVELRIERAGAIVASAGPSVEPIVMTPLQQGDVVRILRDGVERVAVPYDAQPKVDDASCAVAGGTALTGTFRYGEPGTRTIGSPGYGLAVDSHTYLRFALSEAPNPGMTEATITTAGDRWTATFPRPLAPNDGLLVATGYTMETAVGSAVVMMARGVQVCPTPLPPPFPPADDGPRDRPPPPCGAGELRADPAFEPSVRRALGAIRLKHLRRGSAALKHLVVCAHGLVSASIRTTGRRPAVVARGIQPTRKETLATLPLRRMQRAARLTGRRRARVKLVLAFRDSAGETLTWTARATLR